MNIIDKLNNIKNNVCRRFNFLDLLAEFIESIVEEILDE